MSAKLRYKTTSVVLIYIFVTVFYFPDWSSIRKDLGKSFGSLAPRPPKVYFVNRTEQLYYVLERFFDIWKGGDRLPGGKFLFPLCDTSQGNSLFSVCLSFLTPDF